jgi:hypothetical protein
MIRIEDGKMTGAECDACHSEAPPPAEIIKGGGLMKMGWLCVGGKHYCGTCHVGANAAVDGGVARDD